MKPPTNRRLLLGLGLCFGAISTVFADAPAAPARLVSLSTRAMVSTKARMEIVGFVIVGGAEETKQVLLRALGPALGRLGTSLLLAEPTLTLFDARGVMIATNSGWGNAPVMSPDFFSGGLTPGSAASGYRPAKGVEVRAAHPADMAAAGASALPKAAADSAMVAVLPSGAYSMLVWGGEGLGTTGGSAEGIAQAEIYDMDGSEPAHFSNLSARAFVGNGGAASLTGMTIAGARSGTFLLRAVGPTLGRFDVFGTLRKPILAVVDSGGAVIATNAGWNHAPVAGPSTSGAVVRAATAADMSAVGAFDFHVGAADCAMVVTLPPGSYTAKVSGADGSEGMAMVESYPISP